MRAYNLQSSKMLTSNLRKRARYDSGEDLIDPSEMFGANAGFSGAGFGGPMPGGMNISPEMLFNMMGGGAGGPGGGGFSFSTGGGGGSPFGAAGMGGAGRRGGPPFSKGFPF